MNFIIILMVLVKSAYGIFCPSYCKCHMNSDYRFVSCTNKGLISVDLDVPESVEWLQLTNNSIYALYNNVFMNLKLVHIVKLELNRNAINSLTLYSFNGLENLANLDLSYNHLYKLDAYTFERNRRLIELNLTYNPLRFLPEPFLVSPSLKTLILKSCSVGFVSKDSLSGLSSLRVLDISNNQLIRLMPSSLQHLHHLREIYLAGNYLKCDSDSYGVLHKSLLEKKIVTNDFICGKNNTDVPIKSVIETSQEIQNSDVKIINKDYQTFQRMVIDPNSASSVTSSVKPFEDDQNMSHDKFPTTVKVSVDIKNSFNNKYNILLMVIVFLSGTILGAIIAYTSVAFNSLYWLCRKRRRQNNLDVIAVQQTLIQSEIPQANIDPSAPPPSYSQIFGYPNY